MSDLRESGALEQDADLGILIYRPEMYGVTDENAGIAELIVAKHRNGPTGVVRTAFLQDLAKFENLAHGSYS
jgi:replicative DNA helicase